jgi:FdhE protein
MAKGGNPLHDSVPIGEEAKPPFAILPDPAAMFAARAARFRTLAEGHELGPYLLFLAGLCDVQNALIGDLPDVAPPAADALERAASFAMPPLDRNAFVYDAVYKATFDKLLAGAGELDMPVAAREALDRLIAADDARREELARSVLADSAEVEFLADHIFVAAALQVHLARLAATLDVAKLVEIGPGACPSCGGPPVSSLVVGWVGSHGSRFCACAHCATKWNYVRIKCTLCGETKGIEYQEVEGSDGSVKAEICGSCGGYVKALQQIKHQHVEPVADDVASLALDILVREAGNRRGAVNPFLFGY